LSLNLSDLKNNTYRRETNEFRKETLDKQKMKLQNEYENDQPYSNRILEKEILNID